MGKVTTKSAICRRSTSGLMVLGGLILCSISLICQLFLGRTFNSLVAKEITSARLDFSILNFTFKKIQMDTTSDTFQDAVSVEGCKHGTQSCHDEISKDFPRICLDTPLQEPRWEWHNFSKTGSPPTPSQTRLLIAQYSAFGKYARLLELTSPINKEYAKRWNHDLLILQGTTMILPYDKDCTPPEERSRFNKVDILSMAVSSKAYDQLLILDADTLIYDLEYDITSLMPATAVLVAQRTHEEDSPHTKSINNGVTLWNLRNPLTREVAQDWGSVCREGIPDNRPFRGDQYYLREVLNSEEREQAIYAVWNEFYYRDATVIKHFQRSNSRSWSDTGLDSREDRINVAIGEVCNRFAIDVKKLEYINYTAIEPKPLQESFDSQGEDDEFLDVQDQRCNRQRATWTIYPNKPNQTKSEQKRLLIAQYSGRGSYKSLLDMTAPLNLAYAQKWKHDMLVVEGTALKLLADDPCYIAPEKAMYNKLPILIYAISQKASYDQVLILDADSMVVDLNCDISQLMGEGDLLVAQRVRGYDSPRTWNINNGVTLWDLHHPLAKKVTRKWFEVTVEGLTKAKKRNTTEHGDQNFLHRVLKRQDGLVDHVNALAHEFKYYEGTVVKHFVRRKNTWDGSSMTRRKQSIQLAIAEVCERSPEECKDLPRLNSTYAEEVEWV